MPDVRLPDCVIRIEVTGFEIAQVAFFVGRTPHDDLEIVAGVEDRSHIPHLVEGLEAAIRALKSSDWFSLDELDTRPAETKNAPPF